ncbi:MAG: GrdX family protein [Gudongella sp.]|nr:GrdX family protein [Gudongella sp.]
MKNILVTNNPDVRDKFQDGFQVQYLEDKGYIQVLEHVRDMVHQGHQLLTHPLSGSIKPNETPYKSVIMSSKKGDLDSSGLAIVEDSILAARKFITNRPTPDWPDHVLVDFRVIDLSLMENVIEKLGHN